MEAALDGREFLAGARLSVADIALAPYTRMAQEGGFDLGPRPATRAWIARCEAQLSFA